MRSIILHQRKLLEETIKEVSNRDIELITFDIMSMSLLQYHNSRSLTLKSILNKPEKDDLEESLIKWNIEFGHAPAYIFVLNYQPDDETHSNHVFKPVFNRTCVNKFIGDESALSNLRDLCFEDNAILVDSNGKVYATEAQLVNVNPAEITDEKWQHELTHHGYGFSTAVHTRHYSSLGASFHLQGTVVYTLGEKGIIRRFEQGDITFSTLREERDMANVKTRYYQYVLHKECI